MKPENLKRSRLQRRWTQARTASRLGVSQPYLALLESGRRELTGKLTQRAVALFQSSPAELPYREPTCSVTPERVARQLAGLGYPGFAHLHTRTKENPAVVLLSALGQKNLEARLAEALPWVLLTFGADLDASWLAQQARLRNLTNKLGFVTDLARRALERHGAIESRHYNALGHLRASLVRSRLDFEDTFCQSDVLQTERDWLRHARSEDAIFWHLLTDWRAEHLQYAR